MFRFSKVGLSLTTLLALAACGFERAPEPDIAQTGVSTQGLSATNVAGTSLPAKTLALTFDDGPGARTIELSSYLAGQGIRATFFVNGGHLASTSLPNPNGLEPLANATAILARLAADGHLVANHTTTHRDLVTEVLPTGNAKLILELTETDTDIAPYVGSNHFLLRAPYGSFSEAVWSALAPSPMNKYVGPINWEMGGVSQNYPNQAADWACWQNKLQSGGGGAMFGVTTKQCGDAYLTEIASVGRGIVLMHDPYFSNIGSTVDMVAYMVPILKASGYAFVRADEVPAIAALFPANCDASCATCTPAGRCASCHNGAYLSGGACLACTGCAAGAYESAACSAASDTKCTTCSAGTFSAAARSPSCAQCQAGTFAPNAGATSCATCPVGTSSPDGAIACTGCDPGFIAGVGAASCAACEPGTSATAGAHSCAPCEPGTFAQASGSAVCTACPANSYAAGSGATLCTSCESCDDADACTADSCSATEACVHAHVAGCAEADAGAAEGGAPDAGVDASTSAPPPIPDSGSPESGSPAAIPSGDSSSLPTPSDDANAGGDGGGCTIARPAHHGPNGTELAFGLLATFGLLAARARRRRQDSLSLAPVRL